jgi:hypothetical protein
MAIPAHARPREQQDAQADYMSTHTVHFYRDDKTLFPAAAAFIVTGLSQNEPAVIIATPAHRFGILAVLAQAVDVAALQQAGRLIVRDAEEAMAGFMVRGMPDEVLFDRQMTAFVEGVSGVDKRMVHVYGETAGLLWQRGMAAAALALEGCGNRLAQRYAFSFLCSYALDDRHDPAAFESICGAHSHIIPTSGYARIAL